MTLIDLTIIWVIVTIIDLVLVTLALWQSRRSYKSPGMRYIVAEFVGSGICDVIILVLVINILNRSVRISGAVTVGNLLFTAIVFLRMIPKMAFSSYIIGIFTGDGKKSDPL